MVGKIVPFSGKKYLESLFVASKYIAGRYSINFGKRSPKGGCEVLAWNPRAKKCHNSDGKLEGGKHPKKLYTLED